jgi:hypothetical protein
LHRPRKWLKFTNGGLKIKNLKDVKAKAEKLTKKWLLGFLRTGKTGIDGVFDFCILSLGAPL